MKEVSNTNEDWREDWRIMGQEGYLMNEHLHYRGYKFALCFEDYTECEFCWAELKEDEKVYHCPNKKVWICKECYRDFNPYFHWTVEEIE